MKNKNIKIRHFTDLNVWNEAHSLSLDIYHLTKNFPKEEIFGLTSQMRRAAVSITSNIAEGFNRKTAKEKSQFYSIAQGSVAEIQSQLFLARDIKYIPNNVVDGINVKTVNIHKMLTGLLKSLKY